MYKILQPGDDFPNIEAKDLFADAETTSGSPYEDGLRPHQGSRACGWAITFDDCPDSWYFPIRHSSPGVENLDLDRVNRWASDVFSKAKRWINHNVKFDAHIAAYDGIEFSGDLVCTATLSKTIDSDRHNHKLKPLCRDWVGLDMEEEHEVEAYLAGIKLPRGRKCQDWGRVPPEILGRYACMDVIGNRELWSFLQTERPEEMGQLWKTEIALTRVLYKLERVGLLIDRPKTELELARACKAQLLLMERFHEITARELTNSSKLFNEVLCGRYGLPVLAWNYDKKTGQRTGPSFDKNALKLYRGLPEVIASETLTEVVKIILIFRRWAIYQSLFLENFLEKSQMDGRLHSNYNQVVRTGRMSCSDPNTQQFDERAAALITVEEGRKLLCADASQAEFRLIVHYIQDEKAIAAFNENPNTDFHQWVADVCGTTRKPAKALNFAMAYGAGRKRITYELRHNPDIMAEVMAECSDPQQWGNLCELRANELYDTYHRELPGLDATSFRSMMLTKKRGWIRNAYKRRRHLPSNAAHNAFNALIQGCAMDLVKERMVALDSWLPKDVRQLANKHDEILMDGPSEIIDDPRFQAELKEVLETPEHAEFRVPIRWDIETSATSWGEAKP